MSEVASSNTRPASTPHDRLESWKEIAAYLKRDVSTVQRWEKKEGLPVHRLPHDKLGSVFAFRPELDAWWNRGRDRLESADATPSQPPKSAPMDTGERSAVIPNPSPPASPLARPSVTALSVACLVAFFAGGLLVWFALSAASPSPATPAVVRTILPLEPGESLPHNTGGASVTISPDGRYVGYVASRGGAFGLRLRALESLGTTTIDAGDWPRVPFFSPDSSWLGFADEQRRLMRVAVSGGAPIRAASLRGMPRRVGWGTMGFVVTDDSSSGLFLVQDGGETLRPVTALDSSRREKSHRFPQVLPGGDSVLFTIGTSQTDSWNDGLIAVGSLATGKYKIVLEGGSDARYSTSGHLVYARAGSLLAVPFDLEKLEVTGQPVEVVSGVMTSPNGGGAEFALSDTGTLVYAAGRSRTEDRRVVWVDRQGRTEPLIEQPGAYTSLALSPDGRFVALQRQGGLETIVIYDIQRGTPTHWTTEWDNAVPLWSPNGREIVFSSARASPWDLYRRPVDQSKEADKISTSSFTKTASSWSPDGKLLLLNENGSERGRDILVLSMTGERRLEPLVAGRSNEGWPSFSPDGRWIAYESDETGRMEIYICRYPGCEGKRLVSKDGGRLPKWNPNGREIFYRNGDKMVAVAVTTRDSGLALGTPITLFERRYGPTLFERFEVSPDGNRFVDLDASVAEPSPTHLVLVQNFGEELKRRVPTRK